ncbi:GNAT family N-acetyltransferase [Burkholderia sp. F1]|uniref:GNAT family N-acetyltransferase n=1 Tax=Burkholderia sp. F1 TaxID=3366817 RepID=UPI003D737ED8
MSHFSTTITGFWQASFSRGDCLHRDDRFTVTVDPDLDEDSRVMVLQHADRRCDAVLTPALADRLGLRQLPNLAEPVFRRRLQDASVTLHGADYLFYFSESGRDALLRDRDAPSVRRLTDADAAAFAAFEAAASAQDLDDAYVALDHTAAFGAFDQSRLVTAASMYAWDDDARLMDLGVLTLPPFRGKGHARDVVRAIARHAVARGAEPQYRCQLDNPASAALAAAAGLTLFGTWEVVSPDSAQ